MEFDARVEAHIQKQVSSILKEVTKSLLEDARKRALREISQIQDPLQLLQKVDCSPASAYSASTYHFFYINHSIYSASY